MKKQTKLVAVLSAAALLAMGASMTSFAATGWTQEDGTWYYYAKDGSRVTDEWKKSGDYWFYLGDDGEMVTDQLIEDDDDYYYVNQDGAMLTNAWQAVDNEDAGDEDEPDQYWYYFQNNGKAYKGSDSGSTTRFKTINGKKYSFDDEGRMLYGWVKEGERQTGDEDWTDAEYYLGDENDGAMRTGWQLIHILDENWPDGDETFDEDQDRWFYFKSSGKRYVNDKADEKEFVTKTINGKKYGFDENGRMVAEWNIATIVGSQGDADYTKEWSYFSSPEDGARKTKGWFKVIPDEELDEAKYDDCEEYWYYSDGKGKLVANEIKTINGRKYAFNEYGRMLDGLRLLQLNPNDKKEILYAPADDDDSNMYYDTEDNFDKTVRNFMTEAAAGSEDLYAMCYFGASDDGSMKTGKQTVTIDGDKFEFYFEKSGIRKGYGKSGVDTGDKVAYAMGKKYKADSDNKYEIITDKRILTNEDNEETKKVSGAGLLGWTFEDFINDMGLTGVVNEKGDKKVYDVAELSSKLDDMGLKLEDFYIVNTSGSLLKSKSKCKDGDDIVIKVSNWKIAEIYEELD